MTKTLQEHFDFVVGNLLRQNARSGPEDGGTWHGSWYRYEGKKCALGWIIPDDKYRKEMEGDWVSEIIRRFPDAIPHELRSGDGARLVGRLQKVHDMTGVANWKEQFASVAQEFCLDDAVCREPAKAEA